MSEEVKILSTDIEELFLNFPEVKTQATIIALKRINAELTKANQQLIKQKAHIKEVKVS